MWQLAGQIPPVSNCMVLATPYPSFYVAPWMAGNKHNNIIFIICNLILIPKKKAPSQSQFGQRFSFQGLCPVLLPKKKKESCFLVPIWTATELQFSGTIPSVFPQFQNRKLLLSPNLDRGSVFKDYARCFFPNSKKESCFSVPGISSPNPQRKLLVSGINSNSYILGFTNFTCWRWHVQWRRVWMYKQDFSVQQSASCQAVQTGFKPFGCLYKVHN